MQTGDALNIELLARAEENGTLSLDEMRHLLELTAPEDLRQLYDAAYRVKLRYVGNKVRLRGLIEISNYCTKDCLYCGIRKSNGSMHRFRMTLEEICSAARLAMEFDYGSVVLQGGERSDDENTAFVERAVREIRLLSDGKLGITLSLGEQPSEVYRRWFDAGAHRYLLRIESSTRRIYEAIHPADHSFDARCQALRDLRAAGYQVGTGVMSCLPGQGALDLANDIAFFREMDVDMIGMGPYIPHADTPLGKRAPLMTMQERLETGLKMVAVTRLVLRDVNIASTTALQALAPDGRERGLLAGANVIMPNIGDLTYRKDYLLYEGKPGTDENADTSRIKLEQAISAIGESIGYGEWGDSPHFAARNTPARS